MKTIKSKKKQIYNNFMHISNTHAKLISLYCAQPISFFHAAVVRCFDPKPCNTRAINKASRSIDPLMCGEHAVPGPNIPELRSKIPEPGSKIPDPGLDSVFVLSCMESISGISPRSVFWS